jgi:hypothetical protein
MSKLPRRHGGRARRARHCAELGRLADGPHILTGPAWLRAPHRRECTILTDSARSSLGVSGSARETDLRRGRLPSGLRHHRDGLLAASVYYRDAHRSFILERPPFHDALGAPGHRGPLFGVCLRTRSACPPTQLYAGRKRTVCVRRRLFQYSAVSAGRLLFDLRVPGRSERCRFWWCIRSRRSWCERRRCERRRRNGRRDRRRRNERSRRSWWRRARGRRQRRRCGWSG